MFLLARSLAIESMEVAMAGMVTDLTVLSSSAGDESWACTWQLLDCAAVDWEVSLGEAQ